MNSENTGKILDAVIIGGGPIGMACGIECEKHSLGYLIVEKGCLVNSLYRYPLNMTFFSTSEKLEIGDVPFVSHNYKPTRAEALEYFRRVAMKWKLRMNLYEKVLSAERRDDLFLIQTTKNSYQARTIIVASGFYDIPNLMNIPGEELPKVHHYYREAHPYFYQKIVVIGAANSAVDVALECYRKGADVTMIIKNEKLSDSVKYWVKPDVENRIEEGTIRAYFHSKLIAIRETEVEVQTPDGMITLQNDFVVAMTGYLPDFSLLEDLGITIGNDEMRTPSYNEKTMETNQPDIYLAGVICGGLKTNKWFIENSREHAPLIIQDILKKKMRDRIQEHLIRN